MTQTSAATHAAGSSPKSRTRCGGRRPIGSISTRSTAQTPRRANQRKLDAVDQLSRLAEHAGIALVQMAIAFVLRHAAITAPIIGPRTMEHLESQLAAPDVVRSDEVLDRIDPINPPGVTINHLDNGWTQPALQPAARRR
jgi:aryl-alcohol dehydrogenase-like predicted oxidoreductase